MIFQDREEAGRLLGERLAELTSVDWPGALVLGIPRGGVIVAAAAARRVGAALDILVPAKIRAPSQPELAIGAVAPDGSVYVDMQAIGILAISPELLAFQIEEAKREIDRRTRVYRGDRQPPQVAGRTVVLVDDGVATGATIIAAARAMRTQGPSQLLIGVPVAPPASLQRLAAEVDQVVCLAAPERFVAVGQWYGDFDQVGDDEVRRAANPDA